MMMMMMMMVVMRVVMMRIMREESIVVLICAFKSLNIIWQLPIIIFILFSRTIQTFMRHNYQALYSFFSRTIHTFMRSPSFRLSTPFFTIRLMGALNKNVWYKFDCSFWFSLGSNQIKDQIELEANISEAKGVNANGLIYEGDQSVFKYLQETWWCGFDLFWCRLHWLVPIRSNVHWLDSNEMPRSV